MRRLAAEPRFALGHEDSTDYGVGWKGRDDHSDVEAVCGSHVAVYGWDLFRIEKGQAENGDGVNFDRMKLLIEQAYARGGIVTISWHVDNPKSGGDAWDTTRAVEHVLPGGGEHALYLGYLDRFAEFVARLRGPQGERIPVIVRPYHEHTGSWFWWGKAHAREEEYRALWRLTVDRWREHHGLSHLLFAFSPSGGDVTNEQEYLYGYPGDAYVDVLGGDYYYVGDSRHLVSFVELTVEIAKARGKVPALTEFGPRGGVNGLLVAHDWLGKQLLAPLVASERGLGIAYALAWRNAREDHAFLPYPGHAGEADLRAFCDHPAVVMQRDLPPSPASLELEGAP